MFGFCIFYLHRKGVFTLSKVVFLACDDLNPGGAERQCLLLAKKLTKDWKPILVSFSDGSLRADYLKAGIPVFLISRSTRFDFFSPVDKLRKLINSHHPVLLHSWGWMATVASSIVTCKKQISHISSTVRMGTVPPNTRLLQKLACKLGSISVANSRAGLKAWNVPKKKSRVVYNGFDWGRMPQNVEKLPGERKFRVLMTASMSPKKDWDAFLQAAYRISQSEQSSEIEFYGYGDGSYREQILNSAKDLINEAFVFLPGRTLDPIQECLNADIGILLSPFGEGLSNSIMEYMACGLPVICSYSGGNPELVIDGITGFLVDPDNNPRQIADKILWLKDNPDKAKAMGLAGKEHIKNHFSTEQMLQCYLDLYNQALMK